MSIILNNGNNAVTITVSSGTGAYTFRGTNSMQLKHLYIVPENDTTTYSWKITDKNSVIVAQETGYKKQRSVVSAENLPQYLYGNFTFTLFNVDNDEDFTVLVVYSEKT